MSEFCIVVTTTPSEDLAETIARDLLQSGLAACVQISGAVTSHYVWDGELQKDREFRVLIKTRKDVFARIDERISELHSYDVPQVVAIPVTDLSEDYQKWLDELLS